jgi:hypothetical protein
MMITTKREKSNTALKQVKPPLHANSSANGIDEIMIPDIRTKLVVSLLID